MNEAWIRSRYIRMHAFFSCLHCHRTDPICVTYEQKSELVTFNWQCKRGQSLFKTSHVTQRPSLKRLSGIQVQLLSLCMGKHQILQNCSLSLRLNFIFEITNEIGQQLCHKCCFFCSNSVIKSLFLRLDQPVRMHSPARASQSADCFYRNRDF